MNAWAIHLCFRLGHHWCGHSLCHLELGDGRGSSSLCYPLVQRGMDGIDMVGFQGDLGFF